MENSTALHDTPPTAGYFIGWWGRTILIALAIGLFAPFAFVATLFWLGISTGSLDGADLQDFSMRLAASFSPVAWEAKTLPQIIAVSLALSIIVVFWRTTRTRYAKWIGQRFVRGAERPVRLLLRRAGFQKASLATHGDVFGWSLTTAFLLAFAVVVLRSPHDPDTHRKIAAPSPAPVAKDGPAGAIIRTQDGQVIAGDAIIEQRDGQWIVAFKEATSKP